MAKYLAIKDNDIDNGPGLRVSVWFSGCPHKCRGCHNPESFDETKGKDFTISTIDNIVDLLDGPIPQDLSILGGEPLAPYNVQATVELIVRAKGAIPNLKIWLWTGYTVEQLFEMEFPGAEHLNIMDFLDDVDVIVDGRFIESFKSDDIYRGSSNQRIIDNKASIETGQLQLF